jgi:hypothetical protein
VHQHHALLEALGRDRVAELRHSAGASAHIRREPRWYRPVAAARRQTGWLLVDMGLRLAVPRAGVKPPIARGHR